jgi:hypothetical protein
MSGLFLGSLTDALSGAPAKQGYSFLNEAPVETLRALYNAGYSIEDIADHTGLLKFEVSRKLGLDNEPLNNPTPGLGFNPQNATASPVTSILTEHKAAAPLPSEPKSIAPDQQASGWLSIHQNLDQALEANAPQPAPGAVDWSGRALNDWEVTVDQALSHYRRAAIDYHRNRPRLGRII